MPPLLAGCISLQTNCEESSSEQRFVLRQVETACAGLHDSENLPLYTNATRRDGVSSQQQLCTSVWLLRLFLKLDIFCSVTSFSRVCLTGFSGTSSLSRSLALSLSLSLSRSLALLSFLGL